jgi:hypothetical protein
MVMNHHGIWIIDDLPSRLYQSKTKVHVLEIQEELFVHHSTLWYSFTP